VIAFINNLSFGETLVIGVLAILFFGRRLPEVAAQAGAKLQDLKRSMNDLRRDIGLDEQLREAQERMRVLEREARARSSAPPPLVEARTSASNVQVASARQEPASAARAPTSTSATDSASATSDSAPTVAPSSTPNSSSALTHGAPVHGERDASGASERGADAPA